MSAKIENLIPVQLSRVYETEGVPSGRTNLSKKTFVELGVMLPVDVLEATTFFQFTESGVTN